MKKITLTLSLLILSALLFGCSGRLTPEQTPAPSITLEHETQADTEAHLSTATFTPLTTPIPNENGLTIAENEIIGQPSLDPLTFRPVHGSQEAILERNAAEKGEPYSLGTGSVTDSEGHLYQASEESNINGSLVVNLSQDGEIIFQVSAGDVSPINPFRGLWLEDNNHWALEIAYITTTTVDNAVQTNAVGQVYRDGVSLNELYGYEEIFGYQLLAGKPFFFYKLDGKIHLSYDGETLPIWYDEVYHYQCCSGAILNPTMGNNWVGFWCVRDGVTYYTEIGKY